MTTKKWVTVKFIGSDGEETTAQIRDNGDGGVEIKEGLKESNLPLLMEKLLEIYERNEEESPK